jgi:hydroxypyruvate isomerase
MLNFCANVSWMFREVPFLDRPHAARRAGFRGIEFHTSEPHSAAEVAHAARDAGVTVVLFNAPPADFLSGGPGLIGVPGREAEFRQAVRRACNFGASLGGVDTCVQIGQSRVPPGVSREECMRVYIENLRCAASELAHGGCRPLVEPMNATDFPEVLIPDVPTALAAIEAAGDPRIGLQLDAYHQYMSGEDVASLIAQLGERVSHVQLSDAPGRQEPGTGRIDFGPMFLALERLRYRRWVSAEYRPSRATERTLGWLRALGV